MRIAHVITRLIIGGAQENTLLTCAGLAARGHEVTLLAGPETGPEGSLWERAEQCGARLIRVADLCRRVSPMRDLRCAWHLADLFRREGFEVVHTHSSKAGIVGRWAARQAGVPCIVHTIHGMSFNRTQSAPVRAFYRALEKRAAGWTQALVSVAEAMTRQSVAAGVAPAERFITIRSGMETHLYGPNPAERARVRAAWGVGPEAVVIGTVARLFRNKGYEHLLAALPTIVAACPQVHCVWIGDGPHRTRYLQRLEELGLRDRVHLTGLVDPAEIPGLLNGLDILVHASLWEGLPRALVQAALTEVPAVSFDNDGAPEALVDGSSGYLVPLGDTALLARRVSTLAADGELRRRFGRAARSLCLERFAADLMVRQIAELYDRLRAGGPVAG